MHTTKWILALLTISMLQGCMDAAVTGAQVAYNHNSIQKSLNDQYISTQAYNKLYKDSNEFSDSNISVSTFHQQVLLTGQVQTPKQREKATTIVKNIPDVKKVYNLTEIGTPASPLVRFSDTWITSKIKTKLVAMDEVDPNQIKVVTENGTVFLMGIVMPEEADVAVDVARNTDGVQNVVKIFNYLRISSS